MNLPEHKNLVILSERFILYLITFQAAYFLFVLCLSCKRYEDILDTPPVVVTGQVESISSTTAVCSGEVLVEGGDYVTIRGVCWSKDPLPLVSNSSSANVNGKGIRKFSCDIKNLEPESNYYIRAFAANKFHTAYGDVIRFTTKKETKPYDTITLPGDIITIQAEDFVCTNGSYHNPFTGGSGFGVCKNESFIGWVSSGDFIDYNVNIPEDGAYEIVYNISSPNNSSTISIGTPWSVFNTVSVPNSGEWNAYQKLVASNTVNYAMGNHIVRLSAGSQKENWNLDEFTLQKISEGVNVIHIPIVKTEKNTSLTKTTLTCYAEVVDARGVEIIERGICYSKEGSPTILSSKKSSGKDIGKFTQQLTNLRPGTIYYLRAYAINKNNKVGYGENISATTKSAYPNAYIYELTGNQSIIIDGIIEPAWKEATPHAIELTYRDETPTITYARWRATWDKNYIFVVVEVKENNFYSSWMSGLESWHSDKPEIYFDVNDHLRDGFGTVPDGIGSGNGHYQVAPDFSKDSAGFKRKVREGQFTSCTWLFWNASYIYEYAVSFGSLRDNEGNSLNLDNRKVIGFDVCIIDLDEATKEQGRQRLVWSNKGKVNENWFNMDDAGKITF